MQRIFITRDLRMLYPLKPVAARENLMRLSLSNKLQIRSKNILTIQKSAPNQKSWNVPTEFVVLSGIFFLQRIRNHEMLPSQVFTVNVTAKPIFYSKLWGFYGKVICTIFRLQSSNLFHFIMNFLRGPLVVVLQIRIRLDLQHSLNYFLDLDQSFKFGLRSQFWFVENWTNVVTINPKMLF